MKLHNRTDIVGTHLLLRQPRSGKNMKVYRVSKIKVIILESYIATFVKQLHLHFFLQSIIIHKFVSKSFSYNAWIINFKTLYSSVKSQYWSKNFLKFPFLLSFTISWSLMPSFGNFWIVKSSLFSSAFLVCIKGLVITKKFLKSNLFLI